jgi:hypothetical protein
MKTPFNNFDVVRYKPTAAVVANNQHATDYIGIIKEASDSSSYIEWYDAKSKISTREVSNLIGWIPNSELELVGSLFHMLTAKQTMAAAVKPKKVKESVVATAEPRQKRKYTRKPGAAKPGPKPKKDKVVKEAKAPKAPKEEVIDDTVVETVDKKNIPVPMYRWKQQMTREWFNEKVDNSARFAVIATGKFKNFKTRPAIEKSITDSRGCYLSHKIGYGLDFAIVGDKPGPSKIQKFKYFGIPTITEEQWMALIGIDGYEFAPATPTTKPAIL